MKGEMTSVNVREMVNKAKKVSGLEKVKIGLARAILGRNFQISKGGAPVSKQDDNNINGLKSDLLAKTSYEVKCDLLDSMRRKMIKIKDISLLEAKVARDMLPKLFEGKKAKAEFFGLDNNDMDMSLNSSSINESIVQRIMNKQNNYSEELIMKLVSNKGENVVKDGDMIGITFMAKNQFMGFALIKSTATEDEKLAKKFQECMNDALEYDVFYRKTIEDTKLPIYSYRYMKNELKKEASFIARGAKPNLSVLMIDIDHFKRVNDTYGHPAGDDVLIAVANAINGRIRRGDSPCRFGGEEIFVILPVTKISDATVLAEDIKEAIKSLVIKTQTGEKIKVTVSIGVANVPANVSPDQKDEDIVASLINSADKAMYAAKGTDEKGEQLPGVPKGERNRTVVNVNGNWMLADEAIRYWKDKKKEDSQKIKQAKFNRDDA